MADFDFSTLVTDRSPSDLELLRDLLSTPMSDWTEEQLAEFNLARSKGAYNYTDLNRVGNAVSYVAGRLTEAGYLVPVSPKIDWTESDIPKESDMQTYLADVETIRNTLTVLPDTPEVPEDMAGLTYEEANDIERILLAVDALITNMINAYFYSNEINCGEV